MKLHIRKMKTATCLAVAAALTASASAADDTQPIEIEGANHTGSNVDDPSASGSSAVAFNEGGQVEIEAILSGNENALTLIYKSPGQASEISIAVNGGALQFATLAPTDSWTPFTFDAIQTNSGGNLIEVITDGGLLDAAYLTETQDKEGKCLASCKGKDSGNGGTLTPGDFVDSDHSSTPLSNGDHDVQRAFTNGNSQLVGGGIGLGVGGTIVGVLSLATGPVGWITGGVVALCSTGAGVGAGYVADEYIYQPAATISNWTIKLWDNPCPTQCVLTLNFTITQTEAEGATCGGGANEITAEGTHEATNGSIPGMNGLGAKRWSPFPSATIKGGAPNGGDSGNIGLSVVARCGSTGEFRIKWAGGDDFLSGTLECINNCD